MDYNKLALELHQKYKGKITTALRDNDEIDRDKLSSYYSPGVGAVSQAIAENPADLPKYTWTNKSIDTLFSSAMSQAGEDLWKSYFEFVINAGYISRADLVFLYTQLPIYL